MTAIGAESTINSVITVVAAFAIIMCFYLQGKLNDMKKYGYLITILAECMKKHRTLGFIVDKSGVMIPFVAEPDESHVGLAVNPGKYILLAPDLVKPSARMELFKGPKVLMYTLPYFFPQSIQSAAALTQLAEKIHKHPTLSKFRNDVKILELMFNNTGTFQDDCRTFVETMLGKVQLPDSYQEPESVCPEEDEEESEEEEETEEQEDEEEEPEETVPRRKGGRTR